MEEESIFSENTINPDKILKDKSMLVVKCGSKYVAKNSPEAISKGKPRYILVETPYKFGMAMAANDACKAFSGAKIERVH